MEQLFNILNSIKPLSEKLIFHLKSKIKQLRVNKKSILLEAGNISNKIFFIEKGIIRAYYLTDGKEHTTWFYQENDLIFSIQSFYNQTPSYEFIETLEECTLWYINYSDILAIYDNFPEFNFHGRVLTEKYYCESIQRNFILRSKSSEEKYRYLINHIPNILNRVSLKKIASFIEIEPETLSRIRASKYN